MKKAVFFIMLLIIPVCQAFAFNHPEIHWKSVTTDNFVINYYDQTEASVYPVWKIADESYAALSKAYSYTPRRKINLSLASYDDYSNGFAEWTAGNILIWIPESRFELRGNSVWLRNVIVHELAHIISLEQRRGFQLLDLSFSAGYSSPNTSIELSEPFARFSALPNWASEGLAQLESFSIGNDCWDSRRDMILRGALLGNKELSLNEMAHFNHTSLGNELVYNQGFSFSYFLQNRIGLQKYRDIFNLCSREKIDFTAAVAEHSRHSLSSLYTAWKDSCINYYKKQIPPEPTKIKSIWSRGIYNSTPRYSKNGQFKGWLTSNKDDGGRTDLILTSSKSNIPLYRIPYAHTSWDFGRDGNVYYIKSRNPDRNGSYFNDLFCFNLKTNKESRLTKNARLYHIRANNDASKLICVRYSDNAYSLWEFSTVSRSFSLLRQGTAGEPFLGASYSPDSSRSIVLTKLVSGKSKLFIHTSSDSALQPVFGDHGFNEESPIWAKDGSIYYSADYDGIFNIYSVNLNDSVPTPLRHTNAVGGFFEPVFTSSGTLFCSSFDTDHFSIVELASKPSAYSIPQSSLCSFRSIPVPERKVKIKSVAYAPSYLRPVWSLGISGAVNSSSDFLNPPAPGPDSLQIQASGALVMSQSDALDKKAKYLAVGIGALTNPLVSGSNDFQIDINKSPKSPAIQNNEHFDYITRSAREKFDRKKIVLPHLKTNFSDYKSSLVAQESENDSVLEPPVVMFALPAMGWINTQSAATISLQLDLQLAMFIAPVYFSVMNSYEWQLTRETYIGLSPYLFAAPLQKPALFGGALPLYYAWQRIGYYNEDFTYNTADMSRIQIMIGPQILPAAYEEQSYYGEKEYYLSYPKGIAAGIDLFHSIPVFRYSALGFSLFSQIELLDKEVIDNEDLLSGNSPLYLNSSIGIRGTFPIIRTINKKSINYFDALYGTIGYSALNRINKSGLNTWIPDMLRDDVGGSSIDHWISAGLTIGMYKSYLFFRTLSVQANYEMINSSVTLSIGTNF